MKNGTEKKEQWQKGVKTVHEFNSKEKDRN